MKWYEITIMLLEPMVGTVAMRGKGRADRCLTNSSPCFTI